MSAEAKPPNTYKQLPTTTGTGGLRRAVLDWVARVSYPEAWGAPLGTLPALPRGGIPDAPVRVVASGVGLRRY